MTIALTGATGHLGSLVVPALLARGVAPEEVVAVVRDAAKAKPFADLGVQVRVAAYGDGPALDAALTGVERLLLISSSEVGQRAVQHQSVIDAAKAAGVGFIAYTSLPHADTTTNPLAPEHKATEEHLAASGLPYAVLRNGWYSENYDDTVRQGVASGSFIGSAGDGLIASAARADFAEAAAVVLTTEVPSGVVYELSGDVAWSLDDLAATISGVAGTTVAYQDLSTEEHIAALVGFGLDEGTAGFVAALDSSIARGELAATSGDLSALIGRPTTPLADSVRAALA